MLCKALDPKLGALHWSWVAHPTNPGPHRGAIVPWRLWMNPSIQNSLLVGYCHHCHLHLGADQSLGNCQYWTSHHWCCPSQRAGFCSRYIQMKDWWDLNVKPICPRIKFGGLWSSPSEGRNGRLRDKDDIRKWTGWVWRETVVKKAKCLCIPKLHDG